jgi:hypothetical protein
MHKSLNLSIAFSELQHVQSQWTLDDAAVFEKMLLLVGRSRKNRISLCKRALERELRLGRRTLDKSLDRLTRAGLIILVGRLDYSIADIPIILERYYVNKDRKAFEYKLKYYLEKPFGKFSITDASK